MTTTPKPLPVLEDLLPRLDGYAVVDVAGDLTDFGQQLLEFEKSWWKYPAVKETTIRERWEISATRYYQLLNHLIDKDAAVIAEPLLVRRLRRLRAARREQRNVRRLQDGAE